MAEFDVHRDSKFTPFIASAFMASGNVSAPSIDSLGFNSIVFFLSFAPLAGTLELFIQGSHDDVTFVDVPADEILGRKAALTADGHVVSGATGAAALRFGVLSTFRYYRLRMGGAGASFIIAGGAVLTEPTDAPEGDQY